VGGVKRMLAVSAEGGWSKEKVGGVRRRWVE